MKVWLAVAAGVLLLAPGIASAQVLEGSGSPGSPPSADSFRAVNAHPAECARLARQIDHFTMMAQRAEALENEMWVERLEDHLELLQGMQAARCPDDVPIDSGAEAFKYLVKLAAKAALTYFTFGAAGF
jgi:hypothetical protein